MANESQLRLPIQTVPVNRSETLPAFVVTVKVRDPSGGEVEVQFIPEVYATSGVRDSHAYLSSEVSQRVGICPLLSAYAVARCFRAGGLF